MAVWLLGGCVGAGNGGVRPGNSGSPAGSSSATAGRSPSPSGAAIALTVSGTSATVNVALNATISATFSRAINCSTVTGSTFRVNNGAIAGTVSCTGTTARFTPSSGLANGTTYSATLTGGGIKDTTGNALAGNYTWTFTTVSARPVGGGSSYFSWDVESNTTSIGAIHSYFGATTRDCAVAHSGACSMRMNVIGNDGGNQQLGADVNQNSYPFNVVGGATLYYRWWMRIEPGFNWGSGTAKTKSSRTGGGPISNTGTMAQGYTGYLRSYGFLIGECDSAGCRLANGAINDDSNLYIPYDFRTRADGIWHEYIVKVRPNTSATCTAGVNCDAEFQAWVDGAPVGQYNNFKLHDNASHTMVEAWGGWMVTPYFQLNGTSADGGTIYVDDFSTSGAYNSLR